MNNILIISTTLLHLLILLSICSVKLSRSSNISPRCFLEEKVLLTILLKVNGIELVFLAFLQKNTTISYLI